MKHGALGIELDDASSCVSNPGILSVENQSNWTLKGCIRDDADRTRCDSEARNGVRILISDEHIGARRSNPLWVLETCVIDYGCHAGVNVHLREIASSPGTAVAICLPDEVLI